MNLALFALTLAVAAPPSGGVYSGRDSQLTVATPRMETSITVDGVLDEAPWAEAARLVDFSEYAPVDGRPAADETEVLVWYSPTTLYFGIRAHARPGTVHATLADRDHIDADDAIQIFLDTFNDRRQALVFGVNPLGVQADGSLVEGSGNRGGAAFSALESGREVTDLTPDFVYESKGRVTDTGYEVEIAIPFKTLRFPPDVTQRWAVNITRRVQSSGREDSWVPARRAQSSFLAQSGQLDGLTNLRRGLVLDLNPVVTARADGHPDGESWRYDTPTPEFGGNVRWGVTPNLTLNGTVNPDFSQVEADASQVVYDPRSALYFPEKRPFFLDGSELFTTPNNLIYTRRIVAPVAAAKLTGKISGTTVAFLSAVDDRSVSLSPTNSPVFTIARVQRDLGDQSKLGFVYTGRIDGDHSNQVAAADARLVFGSIYSLQLQAGGSRTQDGASATTAPIWQAIFSRDGHHFGYRYQVTGIHDEFRAESGFIGRGGIIHANLNHRVSLFGSPDAFVQSWTTGVQLDGIWQYRRETIGEPWLEKKLHFNNTLKLEKGWVAGGSVLFESFAFDEVLYADYAIDGGGGRILPFVGTPFLHNLDWVATLDTPQFATFSASVSFIWGRDENFFEWSSADIAFATYGVNWRPTGKLRVTGEYQLQSYLRRTDGTRVGDRRIPRLKTEYQLSRSIFFRFIGEYDASRRDALRDDSRTELPLLVRDPATNLYIPQVALDRNAFRVDWLFSYQPTPGTVFFAGYGGSLTEARGLEFRNLRRTADGLFVKMSYLFRM